MDDLASQVLALTERSDYQAKTLRELARDFAIGDEQYGQFRSIIKKLVKGGQLQLGKNRTLVRADPDENLVGLFKRTAKGHGFVKMHTGPYKDESIYISLEGSRNASTGDEVAVRLTRSSHRPGFKREGEIVQILKRSAEQFVGTYFETSGQGYVQIDGTQFHDPIEVGDAGAKGAQPGDKVALEIVRYPNAHAMGVGVILAVLGQRGEPGVDTQSIIFAYNLPTEFEPETLDDARAQAAEYADAQDDPERFLADRTDLRDLLTVTIDPVDARDFDDAISLTRFDDGSYRLVVHVADVAHFVRPGSELDREAKLRGTSVYLPDQVIPMIPEILSNSLASLQAGVDRYAISTIMTFDPNGVRTDAEFHRSVIRVDHRFSYEQAYEAMMSASRDDVAEQGLSDIIYMMLKEMLVLAMTLRRRRERRGALELVMPEVKVDLGDRGEVVGAHLVPHDESHQVIEEFMLAANEAVATRLQDRKAAFLRRAHSAPEPEKLEQFAEFLRSLKIKVLNPQDRMELQQILRETADAPERHAVHYGLLRSLKQAVYTPEAEEHYALAISKYCHFTSPIRRYPDLQVHRQLQALILGKRPAGLEGLSTLAEHCNKTERRAQAAERELIRVKLLTYLSERLGEVFDGVIIGVEEFGFFAQLVEIPIEGLVHVRDLGDAYFYLEAETHSLVARRGGHRYRLGDSLALIIAEVDVDRRQLRLVPAELGDGSRPDLQRLPRLQTLPTSQRGSNRRGTRTEPSFGRTTKSDKRKGKRGRRR